MKIDKNETIVTIANFAGAVDNEVLENIIAMIEQLEVSDDKELIAKKNKALRYMLTHFYHNEKLEQSERDIYDMCEAALKLDNPNLDFKPGY